MEYCRITGSANAGIALQLSGLRILVDAFHTMHIPGFSTMTPEFCAQVLEHPRFSQPDALFFTHCHGDHYAPEWALAARERWPRTTLILPQQEFREQILLVGNELRFSVEDTLFRFLRLTHEGAEYADVPHYGLVVDGPDFRILITGDCELVSPQLARLAEERPITLAVLDFPWLTLSKGQRFVRQVLRPRQLLVNHLPFPADDLNGYRDAARRAAGQLDHTDVRLMLEPLQEEAFSL